MKKLVKKILPPTALSFARDNARRIAGICGNKPGVGTQILSDAKRQIFFGYYDVTPFSNDGKLILAMRAPAENISPHDTQPELELGFFDLSQKPLRFQCFAKTSTWNWQQGCRLQWLSEDSVIYNTAHGAVIQNIYSDNILKKFAHPIYAIDHQRHYALTLNFSRLHQLRRGYGYSNISSAVDGVGRIDLRTGEEKQILNMSDFRPADGPQYYLNHLTFNPSGTRFVVFHIAAGAKRAVRLYTANSDGSGLYALTPDIAPSHYTWMDDENILVTGTKDRKIVYAALQDKSQNFKILQPTQLNEDGHPSLLHNGIILSDTYPDIMGRQKLFLYHPETGKKETLASFYSPLEFSGEVRCDLHPRLSPAQDKIAVDMVHKGRRALCIIRLRRV